MEGKCQSCCKESSHRPSSGTCPASTAGKGGRELPRRQRDCTELHGIKACLTQQGLLKAPGQKRMAPPLHASSLNDKAASNATRQNSGRLGPCVPLTGESHLIPETKARQRKARAGLPVFVRVSFRGQSHTQETREPVFPQRCSPVPRLLQAAHELVQQHHLAAGHHQPVHCRAVVRPPA